MPLAKATKSPKETEARRKQNSPPFPFLLCGLRERPFRFEIVPRLHHGARGNFPLPFTRGPMELKDLRVKIDALDSDLIRLLNERADLVRFVGEIKRAGGLDIYSPEREEALLQALAARNQAAGGRLPTGSLRAIYREISPPAAARRPRGLVRPHPGELLPAGRRRGADRRAPLKRDESRRRSRRSGRRCWCSRPVPAGRPTSPSARRSRSRSRTTSRSSACASACRARSSTSAGPSGCSTTRCTARPLRSP